MVSDERFHANVERFRHIVPQVAARLKHVDASSLHFTKTRQGELNLERKIDNKTVLYHAGYSAQKEAERWFNGLDLSRTKVLYVYGIGLGYYYDAIKPWLQRDPSHYVVFLEDDLAVLRRFFETEKATEVLDDQQVQLHHFDDVEKGHAMFEWLTWYFIRLQPNISALDLYQTQRADTLDQLTRIILHGAVNKEALGSEYQRYGASFFRNFYSNLLELPHSYHGNKLFGKFKGVPAIICGAGPSLNKNIQLLPELRDKALILTGGSALNALSCQGILPHFGGGIDPNPTQYERLMSNFAYEVPFFYRSRMYHKAFRAIHGPRLYINGTGGYAVSNWFEDKFEMEGEVVDEGLNIINLLLEIAAQLGCDPIITVGMDLAFTGMKSYADGIVSNAEVTEEKILNVADLESGAFKRRGVDGKPIYTLWKWVGEAAWISDFAKRHSDRTVINATEGGIGFEGVPNMPLAEVADKHLVNCGDLDARVHSEIQNATIQGLTQQTVFAALEELYRDLGETEELCDGLLGEVEAMQEKIKRGKTIPEALKTKKAAHFDTELASKISYQYVLATLNFINAKVLERRSHQIKYDWTLRSDRERKLEVLRVNAEKAIFIRNAGAVNRLIIEEAVTDFRDRGGETGDFFADMLEKETTV